MQGAVLERVQCIQGDKGTRLQFLPSKFKQHQIEISELESSIILQK